MLKVRIYCITDINGLCYVGKTKLSLKQRLGQHRSDRNKGYCSSSKLNLHNCEMIVLEEFIDESKSFERETYWINKIHWCVNKVRNNKVNGDPASYMKRYQKQHYSYMCSWGGDKRYNNNLLNINIDLFSK